jgi:hypothetical protein
MKMKKYSVPFNFIVWVDVEAEDTAEAREKASDVPFRVVSQWYGDTPQDQDLEVEFNDVGDVYEYEENHADTRA